MKRLSQLSKECIANKGLCCEHRTPPFLLPKEITSLLKEKKTKNKFIFGSCSSHPKSRCPFFKEPFCSVYEKRPTDCRTYPLSIDYINNKLVLIIDMKCPGVSKGLVSDVFIKTAIKIWKKVKPSQEWINEYTETSESKKYKWVTIKEYQEHRKQITQNKNVFNL